MTTTIPHTITPTKTANQLYRESGSKLRFSTWLQQEKDKQVAFIKNKKLNEVIQSATDKANGVKNATPTANTFLGLSKNVIIVSSVIVIAAIGLKLYKNFKK